MQFTTQTLVAFTALLATTQAAVIGQNSAVALDALRKRNNDCGSSTFEGSGYPWATVSDCQQMFNNIAGDGEWYLGRDWQIVARYNNCAFFARIGGNCLGSPRIGNEDIRDLTRDSIAKFGGQGQFASVVGAQGGMSCSSAGGNCGVQWQLTNPVGPRE